MAAKGTRRMWERAVACAELDADVVHKSGTQVNVLHSLAYVYV